MSNKNVYNSKGEELVLALLLELYYQVWFTLEDESLQIWLGYVQSIGTLYNELSDVDLLKQPWP